MLKLLYYYFYNDIFEDFDTKFVKIDKKSYKIIDIVNVDTTLDTSELKNLMIMRVFMVYLRIGHASKYIEEKNGNKYLIFDSVEKKKGLLKNLHMFGMELKIQKCYNIKKLMHQKNVSYWFFKDIGLKFEEHVCNGCHDLLTIAHSLKNIAKLGAKGAIVNENRNENGNENGNENRN